jgi:NAD dependent epimerase/dehydratase family enzyme
MMKSFINSIAKVLGKPAWLKVPPLFLKATLGEMARETLLASQNIYPGKLLNEDYQFKYLHLEDALKNLLNQN